MRRDDARGALHDGTDELEKLLAGVTRVRTCRREIIHPLPRPPRPPLLSSGAPLTPPQHSARRLDHHPSHSTTASQPHHGHNVVAIDVQKPLDVPSAQVCAHTATLPHYDPSTTLVVCTHSTHTTRSYGTLLGSTLFQSFISGVVAFRVLPRPQFSTLQKHTFPIYFALQSIAPVAMALTYPRGPTSLLPSFLLPSSPAAPPPSFSFFAPASTSTSSNKLASWLHATMFVTAVVNLVYVGPKTTEIMGIRKHQETRDGKRSYDNGPHSKEMQALNKQFAILHGVSTVINLVGLGAMIWYGGVLAEGLSI